ncbi:MAG: YciI family protein [Microthrixaceae bacterium]
MKYVLGIYDDPEHLRAKGDPGWDEMMAAFGELNEELKAKDKFIAAEPLQPVEVATTVRVRDHERLLTDGPFAETKEHFLGFYLIEAEDLDEALGYAARIPHSATGSIEVRPVADYS